MIVGATILHPRKASSFLIGLKALFEIKQVDRVYINVEADMNNPEVLDALEPLDTFLKEQTKHFQVEFWWRSRWPGAHPKFDQDQKRLFGIVPARNMAIDYALEFEASHLLFVDADVVPDPAGVQHLIDMNKPLCGGLVPGRGAHGHLHYIFPAEIGIQDLGDYLRCGHGTCGYMLIQRPVFGRLRFRFGHPTLGTNTDMVSEDPAYCMDARKLGLSDGFYIHKLAKATHWDDPNAPLTIQDTCKENFPK